MRAGDPPAGRYKPVGAGQAFLRPALSALLPCGGSSQNARPTSQ